MFLRRSLLSSADDTEIWWLKMVICDIIDQLRERLVDHALATIFRQVDVDCLKNCELVSRGWREAVHQSGIWKKLVDYNVSKHYLWSAAASRIIPRLRRSPEDDCAHYKILHNIVSNSLLRLENNWRSGQFSLGTCSHHVDVQSILFRMDNENIVYDAEGTIKVLDRKTLQVKTAIQYCQLPQLPLNIMTFHFIKPLIITARDNGIIEVWDLNTGEQLNRLVHLEGSNITHLRFNSSLMATISSSNRSPRRPHILNIWQLKNPKDITVHTQIQLPHDHYVELEMDEKFVVVVGEPRDAMEFNQVHIISADTHKIVRTLPYRAPLRFANASMQYHDGFLLSAEPAGIRIVDVGTGDCLSWIRCSWTRYDSLRFNSKYIVAMEKRTKTMVIFDFPSALDPRKDMDKVTLCSFQWPAEGVRKLRNFHLDEFQMVGAGFNTGDRAASFYVLDFFEKVIQR